MVDIAVYPVNLQIDGRRCAVVGGGSVAARKVVSLVEAGACVTVFSPALTDCLTEMAVNGQIIHVDRPYCQGDLAGYFIVICATDDRDSNRQAAEEGHRSGALVNVVDDPAACDFSVPAQVARGDVLFTVSTGGKSPALARRLREELAGRYGPEYGEYLELVAKVRDELKTRLATSRDRESFWRETIDSDILVLLRQGKIKEAEAKIRNAAGCTGTKS